jgi:hypothetical protein
MIIINTILIKSLRIPNRIHGGCSMESMHTVPWNPCTVFHGNSWGILWNPYGIHMDQSMESIWNTVAQKTVPLFATF